MNIVHYADEIWDSGLTEYALTLSCALAARGHNCWFVARPGGHAQQRASALGLQVVQADPGLKGFFRLLNQLNKIKPDIINAHTGSSHTRAVLLALALPGVKVVRTRADARDFRLKPFGGLLWRRTDGFIAANSVIMRQFKAALGEKVKAEIILQGITAPEKPVTPASGEKIGIVARLDPVKGHAVALEALKLVLKEKPGAKLLIAGEDRNITAAALLKQAETLGIAASVELYGRLDNIFDFMDSCGLGLIPSLGSEAVSRGALEWQSRGRAVIASRVGGLADLVIEGETGTLVSPSDPKALAEAILAHLRDQKLLAARGQQAKERFDKFFSPAVFAETTEIFYRKVIA